MKQTDEAYYYATNRLRQQISKHAIGALIGLHHGILFLVITAVVVALEDGKFFVLAIKQC